MQERFLWDKGNLSKLACSLSYPTLYRPPDKKNLKVLWLGEPMPNFFTNPETARPSKEAQKIQIRQFSVLPNTFYRSQNKNLKVLWLGGTYAHFFHKYENSDLDLGTRSCFEANQCKLKKKQPKTKQTSIVFFFYSWHVLFCESTAKYG